MWTVVFYCTKLFGRNAMLSQTSWESIAYKHQFQQQRNHCFLWLSGRYWCGRNNILRTLATFNHHNTFSNDPFISRLFNNRFSFFFVVFAIISIYRLNQLIIFPNRYYNRNSCYTQARNTATCFESKNPEYIKTTHARILICTMYNVHTAIYYSTIIL